MGNHSGGSARVKGGPDGGDPLPPKLRRRMEQIASLRPNDQKALLETIDLFLKASTG
jgi:hypothetical protein